jgi:hypothetical protein
LERFKLFSMKIPLSLKYFNEKGRRITLNVLLVKSYHHSFYYFDE